MTAFVIEKGVPLPPESYRGGGRPLKYDWDKLEVGDSVVVSAQNTAIMGATWAARHDRKFVFEKQQDGSGWRLWRKA